MKCVVCGRAEATHGRYCEPCLDAETGGLTPEELEAAERRLDELVDDYNKRNREDSE